jgi:rRNA maturation RNase YbeY
VGIGFNNDGVGFDLKDKSRHRKWIKECITAQGRQAGNIQFIFTSNARLLRMNKEYLNHNHFTDVITFDYSEGTVLSGDIFISIDQVRDNALYYNTEPGEELRRVMVHGVLHLAGLKDNSGSERECMRKKEEEALLLWQGY